MKAQYKLGQFIQYTATAGAEYGAITGVIQRNDGFYYEVSGNESTVAQKDILSAYRPVTTRKVAATKKTAKTSRVPKSNGAAANHASASAAGF